jgi:hypothetical protein
MIWKDAEMSDEQTHRPYQRMFARKNPIRLRGNMADALDPVKAPGKVKRFAEMTEDERAEMRRLYET